MLVENHARVIELALGARQAGLYYTPINTHLTAVEASFILRDCGARLLITSAAMLSLAKAVGASPRVRCRASAYWLSTPANVPAGTVLPEGFESYEDTVQGS